MRRVNFVYTVLFSGDRVNFYRVKFTRSSKFYIVQLEMPGDSCVLLEGGYSP